MKTMQARLIGRLGFHWLAAVLPALLLLAGLSLLGTAVPGCGGEAGGGDADSTAVAAADSAAADEEDDGDEGETRQRRERATTVNAAAAMRGDLVVPVIAEGALRARKSTEIRAEVGGRLDRVFVEEGQTVRAGQRIAQIDNREYLVALEEARSKYLEALGRLAADDENLDSRSADERLAEQLAELEDLYERKVITAAELGERRIALEVEAAKQGAYRGELVKVRSGLSAARAAQERAELDLERTEIRAPFAGVISGLTVVSGERMTVNQVLCTLVDNVNLEAEVAVLESDLAGLEVGRPVRLEVPALGTVLDVTVDVMSPAIDPESRTCSLLMRFKNDSGALRPGMFVRASIAGEIHEDLLLVPREAVLNREGRPLLFRVEDDRAKWVYITPGRSNDRMVEIERVLQGGPVEDGTLVVVSNHLTLTHDAKVKVGKVVEAEMAWTSPDGDEDGND